ncbi:MAG: carboxypeptidase regulatory-like domain-containing protein [Pseudomonadota bacterium]|nr:carboxypeptidase regulatory-like domain-containing protein [Pseudomonadota bacterium]
MKTTRMAQWATALLCAIMLAPAGAVTLSGQVLGDGGQPLAGALVTLVSHEGARLETVYSDTQGRFQLPTAERGAQTLRVRANGWRMASWPVNLAAEGAQTLPALQLAPEQDARARSDALPASTHAATVKIGDVKANAMYRSQCFFCHQIGNAWTRRAKSDDEWKAAIARMEKYGALITWGTEAEILKALPAAFNGQPLDKVHPANAAPPLHTAKLTEIRVGDPASFLHDVEVGRDGAFYSVDMANDLIYRTDWASGATTEAVMPSEGRTKYGHFSGWSMPIAAFNAYHGPHSIVEGPDGLMYTTNSLSGELGIYDPATRQYRFVKIGSGAIYPHTLRFDARGMLWFTIALSNQVARYDPKTGEMKVIGLPSGGFWRWLTDKSIGAIFAISRWFPGKDWQLTLSHHKWSGQGDQIFNMPYGLDIHPVDGSIWYSKLYSSKIGRVDPVTLAVEEWDTPLKGPRRLRFGRDGTLWIPAYAGSGLMRFDTQAKRFESLPLPTLAQGEFETPYALNVHPATGDVWVTSNLSDRLFRYRPASGDWVTYPTGTQTSYMRDIVFADEGRKVCSMNANLPAAAVEGQHQQLVCLEPDLIPQRP